MIFGATSREGRQGYSQLRGREDKGTRNFEGRKTNVLATSRDGRQAYSNLAKYRLRPTKYGWTTCLMHETRASWPLYVSFMLYIYDVVTILYDNDV